MNDKLGSFLHTAWTEPRRFFFWVALLSLGGFLATARGAALLGSRVFLPFVTLGCVLCFVVSVPAFLLAWLPPVRRLFSWLLGRRFLVLGCLVTLVALFYAIEDWRGRRAWREYKRAWEAKGERFDLASFIPPPVPDDQNFFETPLWAGLHFVQTNGATVWSDPNWGSHVMFSAWIPNGKEGPAIANWVKAQRVDLPAWQAYYRGTNNWFPAAGGPPTNYFPVAKEAQAPAADVLLALGRFNQNRQLLIAAAARPQARFWINYEAGYAAMLPHLARLKLTSQYLSLHATAALEAGDTATALEDLELSFRLIESVRSEPILISHLVRIAMLQFALQPVWEGLAGQQWTAADLSLIERELGKLDFLADYEVAMRLERAGNIWALDYIRKEGISALNEILDQGHGPAPVPFGQFLGTTTYRLLPAGWYDQNKLSVCRLHEQYLLPLVLEPDRRLGLPATVREFNSLLENQAWRPYDMLAKMLLRALARFFEQCGLPQSSGFAERFGFGQSAADLARVACALERYRLANGSFPAALASLAPTFIAKLPHDVVNGQPLHYRRTDDGQFVLYSVGWDQTDDGGTVALNQRGNPDSNAGDWVWRYPVR